MPQTVPHELHALVHHVELANAGWRERALDLMTLQATGGCGSACSRAEVRDRLNQMLAAPLGQAQVEQTLERLMGQGKIVLTATDRYKLSEETMSLLSQQLDTQETLERNVQDHFEAVFADLADVHRIEWTDFQSGFLYPLVSELGAHAYELLSGESVEVREAESHMRFLASVPVVLRGRVSSRIRGFLDAQNPAVRSYVLRLLNTAFLVQATHLSEDTLKFVEKTVGQRVLLNVFVDTNFLFSLIGLHENPADDVVAALHHLIGDLEGRVNVQLYVLPVTLDEARNAVAGYEKRLSRLSMTAEMSHAAMDRQQELSGITMKFIEEAIRSRGRLSAKEYFSPYNKNLLTVARSKGVELYNESTDMLGTDQEVVDDINGQLEFERNTYEEERRKSYKKIRHDMVLWHFTRRKRRKRLESPIDAEFWAATIDFRLLKFDRYKRGRDTMEPPVCIHPTVLLQLLQLWIPRDQLLETALVSSLQPLLPQDFDRDAEAVTIRILKSLSRFENSEALGRDVVARIMVDDAVRSRIQEAGSDEEDNEIVRDALSHDNQRLNVRVNELEETTRELGRMIEAKDSASQSMVERLTKGEDERTELRQQLEEQEEQTKRARRNVREEQERRESVEEEYRRQRAVQWVVGAGIGGVAVIGLLAWLCLAGLDLQAHVIRTLSILLSVGGGLASSSVMTLRRKVPLQGSEWPKWLRRLTAVYWTLVVLPLSVNYLGSSLS